MKIFLWIFGILLLIEASSQTPSIRRWNLQRDDFHNLHLIDLKPIKSDPEPSFNPMNDVFFMLFTRSNPTVGQRIGFHAMDVITSNFNPAHEVRILIHGWLGSVNAQENPRTTADFLRRGDYNVIVVDWSAGSQAGYLDARWRVGDVGMVVGRFIEFLYQHGFTQFSRINLVGHSLGSHVAGHAGKTVQLGKINAIFATDPAADDTFDYNDPSTRLAADDAFYTETIGTNRAILLPPLGHVNFYPNFGATQPGCLIVTCHHHRATEFYGESLNSNLFIARECANFDEILASNCPGTGNMALMGGDFAKPHLRGVYFLETAASSPFALG